MAMFLSSQIPISFLCFLRCKEHVHVFRTCSLWYLRRPAHLPTFSLGWVLLSGCGCKAQIKQVVPKKAATLSLRRVTWLRLISLVIENVELIILLVLLLAAIAGILILEGLLSLTSEIIRVIYIKEVIILHFWLLK